MSCAKCNCYDKITIMGPEAEKLVKLLRSGRDFETSEDYVNGTFAVDFYPS